MRFQSKTNNGYDLFEVVSALQKCIRRGLEDDALFWAVELSVSNYHEYCWKRMLIISSEDIGEAEPALSAKINSLYQMFTKLKSKNDEKHCPERLFLVHAVIVLCRAKKSRYVDWQTCYAFGCHGSRLREIPDFALDKHTQRGKAMGRKMAHFIEIGCELQNYSPLMGEDEAKENALKALSNSCTSLFD
jgi:replication-associated recombination protein RarA